MTRRMIITAAACVALWATAAAVLEYAPRSRAMSNGVPMHYICWDEGDPPFVCGLDADVLAGARPGARRLGFSYWGWNQNDQWIPHRSLAARPIWRTEQSYLTTSHPELMTSDNPRHIALRAELERIGRADIGGMPLDTGPKTTLLVGHLITNIVWWLLSGAAIIVTVVLAYTVGVSLFQQTKRDYYRTRGRCDQCGYNLRGLSPAPGSDRGSVSVCPECGHENDKVSG